MRGYFPNRPGLWPVLHLFPAYAGVFPGPAPRGFLALSLPRLCGGISGVAQRSPVEMGSSPPMRGYFQLAPALLPVPFLFPAYAGVFPVAIAWRYKIPPLPRLCGGISYSDAYEMTKRLSSPPMRGYFLPLQLRPVYGELFPAYAGVFPLARL